MRGRMKFNTWANRVEAYLSNQGKAYTSTLSGLDRMVRLYRAEWAPRDASRMLEREAEARR